MRISDWSSDVCSSDLRDPASQIGLAAQDTQSDTQRTLLSIGRRFELVQDTLTAERTAYSADDKISEVPTRAAKRYAISNGIAAQIGDTRRYNASLIAGRSEEHTSELQSLMRISYAVFCLKKKKKTQNTKYKNNA